MLCYDFLTARILKQSRHTHSHIHRVQKRLHVPCVKFHDATVEINRLILKLAAHGISGDILLSLIHI